MSSRSDGGKQAKEIHIGLLGEDQLKMFTLMFTFQRQKYSDSTIVTMKGELHQYATIGGCYCKIIMHPLYLSRYRQNFMEKKAARMDGFILLYDAPNPHPLDGIVSTWMADIQKYKPGECCATVIGSVNRLPEECLAQLMEVSTEVFDKTGLQIRHVHMLDRDYSSETVNTIFYELAGRILPKEELSKTDDIAPPQKDVQPETKMSNLDWIFSWFK